MGTDNLSKKLFIGVPANTLAANGNAGGAVYYATPAQLATIVQDTKSNPAFGGIMMWAAGYSDANVNNGCTYAQEAKNILLTGAPCGGSQPVSSSLPTTTAKPTKSATSTSSATGSGPTGTVPQWGQVSTTTVKNAIEMSSSCMQTDLFYSVVARVIQAQHSALPHINV